MFLKKDAKTLEAPEAQKELPRKTALMLKHRSKQNYFAVFPKKIRKIKLLSKSFCIFAGAIRKMIDLLSN